jgi:hypothetical protein
MSSSRESKCSRNDVVDCPDLLAAVINSGLRRAIPRQECDPKESNKFLSSSGKDLRQTNYWDFTSDRSKRKDEHPEGGTISTAHGRPTEEKNGDDEAETKSSHLG